MQQLPTYGSRLGIKRCLASSRKTCNAYHYTLLHKGQDTRIQLATRANLSTFSVNIGTEMLLSTVVIKIDDKKGRSTHARAVKLGFAFTS